MTTVKQVCLGVAVAGVVAGAGSAVSTAIANAETGDSDHSATADRNAGPAANTARSSRRSAADGTGRARVPAAAAAVHAETVENPVTVSVAANRGSLSGVSGRPRAGSSAQVIGRRSAATTPATAAVPAPSVPTVTEPRPAAGTVTPTASPSRVAAAQVSPIAEAPGTHVLLIGIDGVNLTDILADPANTGFFGLMDESVTGATSIVGHTTISGPSWGSILTGVWDSKLGVVNNLISPVPFNSWPTVFNQLEAFNPGIETTSIADWKGIADIAGAGAFPVDENILIDFDTSWAKTDAEVVDRTIDLITNSSASTPTMVFSYQVQVDEAGHTYGRDSQQYTDAIVNVSANIAEIMAAVDQWEAETGEEWTVIATTDHGHRLEAGFPLNILDLISGIYTGHGFQSPDETGSFVVLDLAGDSANNGKQNLGFNNTDITPTIVSLFGAPLRSDFDGVPLQSTPEVIAGIVTPANLHQSLRDAVAMFGYPDVGTSIALTVRTVFATVPYVLDSVVASLTGSLQSIVDQDIFLISQLAGITEWLVRIAGDAVVGATQALALGVGFLTGSGVIAPTDPPLTSSAAVAAARV